MPDSPTPDSTSESQNRASQEATANAALAGCAPATPFEVDADEARKVNLYGSFREINQIDPSHYERHDVKRGLRNADGTGVVVGMTNISNVHGYVMDDGEKRADEGSLRFRGYELCDLLGSPGDGRRFNFEEVA